MRYIDEAILYGSLMYRRATASLRVLPEVFLLGAAKCGSTSLAYMLRQHPSFVCPYKKELMYLQKLPSFQSNYEFNRAIAFFWGQYDDGHAKFSPLGYRKFFPLRSEMMLRSIKYGSAFTADCDPFNFYCEVAMNRIKKLVPNAKFIISLRNPVDRAYSDFNMYRSRADEMRSFEDVIDDELSGREVRFRRRFLDQSRYAGHLSRWFGNFPRERFLVINSEDFFIRPDSVASDIFSFLGLSPADVNVVKMNIGDYSAPLSDEERARVRVHLHRDIDEVCGLLSRDMRW